MIITKIDEMVELIKKKKITKFHQISKMLKWNENCVEKIALILEKAGLAKTHYPINMIERPWITLLDAKEPEPAYGEEKGKVLESYSLSGKGSHARGDVRIIQTKGRPVYQIVLPKAGAYTRAYLEQVKNEVSKEIPLAIEEKSKADESKYFALRHEKITAAIKKDLAPDDETLDALCDIVLHEMYGLGELEALIEDRKLEEIVINSAEVPVSVYHRQHGWLKTNMHMKNEEETENYAEQIARKVGRQISILNPILDAHLSTGDRANATFYPVSVRGNTLTLRLFAREPWTIVSYLKKETNALSFEMAALLWQAMQYEMNVVIAGGTASGKTSTLNSLVSLIQPFQRIITIEDTRELMLPVYQWNWIPLVTRMPNPEGLGEVTMLDLLVNSLRMRPDRIVMGEIRRKREAEVLFEAMHTGHSVYSTIHADTGTQVIKRLVEAPIEVPPIQVEDINLLVVQYRDRRRNIRRTLEISEVVPGAELPELSRVYTWKARDDSFISVKPPRRYFEGMNLHTGMTEKEIQKDLGEKEAVLNWMVENNLERIDDIGKVMQAYYADEAAIVAGAEKKLSPKKVI